MPDTKARPRNGMDVLALALPALLYIAVAVPVSIAQRAAINPDGIIYIRKAQFLLAGHVWQSISGYWSPAISWCVALVLHLRHGIDPLHAIHGVLAFWGLTWVVASCFALRSVLPARPVWRLLAGVAISFEGVRQAVSIITPDLLLGTMLMAYLALISSGGLVKSRWNAFLGGLFAGFGFLCKSYALPFFCLHFPLTVAYGYWTAQGSLSQSKSDARRGIFLMLIAGFIGFALPALPWVGILSTKYGHFTISMVYHHNHINVADKPTLESLPDFCIVPPDPYLTIWEGLDPGPRLDWSPFASGHNFEHQIEIGLMHAWQIILDLVTFDHLGLILIAGIAALLPLKRAGGVRIFSSLPIWIVLTGCVYCLGFLIVAFEVRYIVPILFPLGMALCLLEWQEIGEPMLAGKPWLALTPFVIAALFVASALMGMWQYAFYSPARPIYAQVATWMRKKHLDGLFASSDNNKGVNVAYFLNRKVVLIPYTQNDSKLETELSAAGVNELIVWSDSRFDLPDVYSRQLTEQLLQSGLWNRAEGEKLDSVRRVDVYLRRAASPSAPATQQAD